MWTRQDEDAALMSDHDRGAHVDHAPGWCGRCAAEARRAAALRGAAARRLAIAEAAAGVAPTVKVETVGG